MKINRLFTMLLLLFSLATIPGCGKSGVFQISQTKIEIHLPSANFTLYPDGRIEIRTTLAKSPPSTGSPFLEIKDGSGVSLPIQFQLGDSKISEISDSIGSGQLLQIPGKIEGKSDLMLNFRAYRNMPDVILSDFSIQNTSTAILEITEIRFLRLSVSALDFGSQQPYAFWSFQGASYESRPDWILPLKPDFYQENFLGMNASDYGGGVPVLDLWGPQLGLAIAHLSKLPQRVAFPVQVSGEGPVDLFIRDKHRYKIEKGNSFKFLPTAIILHSGDYFNALVQFRQIMVKRGFPLPTSFSPWAYEPSWCAWGYERDFKFEEIKSTLPKVKELGFKWVGLDDGWQTANGDWEVRADKYPGGEEGLKKFIKELHEQGFKVQLWWVPFDAAPNSKLIKEHPDWLLINEKGERQPISWWNTYYLDPSYPPVIEYTRKLIQKFFKEWDIDGLKIDGQLLNAVPPCYNPAHNHKDPEESYRSTPAFFKMIFEEARKIKPNAVIQICPGGEVFSFYHMPYLNQPVASDPLSSWQTRLKGKGYKALMGPDVPYYGDHVELSDGGDDFASQIGIGGIPGSKFTWPFYPRLKNNTYLTPEKEKLFKKWLGLYNRMELSKGQYTNVYDMGWDDPEGHLIIKDGRYYYAFYARQPKEGFSGTIELRGLEDKTYQVRDYWNEKELGTVQGPVGELNVQFQRFLLLEVK